MLYHSVLDLILHPGDWHHLRYEIAEDTLSVSFNGGNLFEASLDSAFSSGLISFEAPRGTCYLDNLRVEEITR